MCLYKDQGFFNTSPPPLLIQLASLKTSLFTDATDKEQKSTERVCISS